MARSDERATVWLYLGAAGTGNGGVRMTLQMLRDELAAQGLHVVSDADMRVLEAAKEMLLVKDKSTRPPFAESVVCRGGGKAVVDAEWARREGKL